MLPLLQSSVCTIFVIGSHGKTHQHSYLAFLSIKKGNRGNTSLKLSRRQYICTAINFVNINLVAGTGNINLATENPATSTISFNLGLILDLSSDKPPLL